MAKPVSSQTPTSVLATVLDSLPTAAALIDANMIYVMVNQHWRRQMALGYDLKGRSHRQYFPHHAEQWATILKECAEHETYQWQDVKPAPSNHDGESEGGSSHLNQSWAARHWQEEMQDSEVAIAGRKAGQDQNEGILLIASEPLNDPLSAGRSSRQLYKEQIVSDLSSKVHQLLDLDRILQTTVQEVRQFLDTDRVVIYQFTSDWSGTIVVESVDERYPTVLGASLRDPCFSEKYIEPYRSGRVHVVNNVLQSNLIDCYVQFLQQFQVQANLAAPIISDGELWGLICVHECRSARYWQPIDVSLVEQIATHVGIAIQQASLYQQLQRQLAQQEANLERAIADQLSKEKALRQSEQRRSLLFEQTSVAVIEMDCDFTVTAWNPAAEQVFGYEADEAIGQPIQVLIIPPEEQAFVDEVFDAILNCATSMHTENYNVTKDGRRIICDWYDVRLVDESGALLGVASLALDITQRKQAEEALRAKTEQLEQTLDELQHTQMRLVQSEKMSSLGQLVAGIAHEINNPVNFIYGNLSHARQYLQDLLQLVQQYQFHYPVPPPALEATIADIELDYLIEDFPKTIQSMQVGTERIRQIITSLRNFSRLDEAELKAVNIHDGIDSTLMILQNRLKAKPSEPGIQLDKSYGELMLVECYPGPLNQVVMNILANAIDALDEVRSHPDDAPQIRIVTEYMTNPVNEGDRPWVRIRIADNGPGISDAKKEQIFNPFFTTKAPGKGTGLGLSISYQIVRERHHGQLRCYSEPGKGTEFVIEIPSRQ
jgi:PAS domain S-box-containing protein